MSRFFIFTQSPPTNSSKINRGKQKFGTFSEKTTFLSYKFNHGPWPKEWSPYISAAQKIYHVWLVACGSRSLKLHHNRAVGLKPQQHSTKHHCNSPHYSHNDSASNLCHFKLSGLNVLHHAWATGIAGCGSTRTMRRHPSQMKAWSHEITLVISSQGAMREITLDPGHFRVALNVVD